MTANRLHASEASREIEIKQKLSNESQTCLTVSITLLNEPIKVLDRNRCSYKNLQMNPVLF